MLEKYEENINFFLTDGKIACNLQRSDNLHKVLEEYLFCKPILKSEFITKYVPSEGRKTSLDFGKPQDFVSGWETQGGLVKYFVKVIMESKKVKKKNSFGILTAVVFAGNVACKTLQSYQIINIDSGLNGTICFSFGDITKHFD